MNADAEREPGPPNGMAEAARKEEDRRAPRRTEGEQSVMRFVGQSRRFGLDRRRPDVVWPFAGRWLDRSFGTGIFWSAALLVLGVTVGFWSAWRWMQRQ